MRIAIISDIHGNLPALEKVMEEIVRLAPDKIICLGDLVGYGPQPNECIDIIRESKIPTVLGNHDAAMVGKVSLGMFREPNASLIRWSLENLTDENKQFIADLPYTLTEDNWIAAHAHPSEPESWKYLQSAIDCRKILSSFPEEIALCFVGHTHIPALVAGELGIFGFEKGNKYVINPGSVGQSRDNDSRASFSVIDTDEWTYKNIRLDYATTKIIVGFESTPISKDQGEYMMRLRNRRS